MVEIGFIAARIPRDDLLEQLAYQARHDPLTRLANRRAGEIHGRPGPDPLIGRRLDEIADPEHRDALGRQPSATYVDLDARWDGRAGRMNQALAAVPTNERINILRRWGASGASIAGTNRCN